MGSKKRNYKKYAQSLGKYEGRQYKGGRDKGRKNLVRVDGGYKNEHGVIFTEEQKKALERSVNRSNYRRKKMIAEVNALRPEHKYTLGTESDFIIARQSKSLQRFTTMEGFERFMDKQARIQSGKYLEDMTRHYKRSYMKALDTAFGDQAKDVKMKIRMMKPDEYRKLVEEKGDELEIHYVYGPDDIAAKLNNIRSALGMKEKEFMTEVR